MHNMALIFRDEVRRMMSNVVSVVIAIGLVVMPSIFAWYNIIACWNVFDNTGNLTVAVANDDEGYESDLFPLRVNIGEQVVSALRANSQIDWVFTDTEDAMDGARSGRYYAAVVIPKEFSRDMLTFYAADAEHASIVYYSNEKVSAIAPKITDQGADTVSYEVNQVFAKTLSEVALSIAESVARYAEDADAGGRIAELAAHIADVADEVRDAASVLGAYGSLASSAADLVQSARGLSERASHELDGIKDAARAGADGLVPLTQGLKDAVGSVSDSLGTGAGSYDELAAAVGKMFDDAGNAAAEAADAMRTQADGLEGRISASRQMADQLEAIAGQVSSQYQDALTATVQMLRYQADSLEQMQGSLRAAAQKLDAGNGSVAQERAEVEQLLDGARANAEALKASFDEMRPGLEALAVQASQLASNVRLSLEALDGIAGSLGASSEDGQGALAAITAKLEGAKASLMDAAASIDQVAEDMTTALAQGDEGRLQAILTSDVAAFSSALAAPIQVERIAVYPAENFGSQMAPLYTTLALFIGSLLILVVLKPVPCRQTLALLTDPKPRQVFLGHFGIMAFVSWAQTTLTALGNMFFLQVQVAHPWLYVLVFWLAGLVFTFLIYALVVSFANLGKALAVLLLIIQVTGCGGSFPLQILPPFVQALSPYLPATYVVNAMREAMMGTYGSVYWEQVGGLLLFLIPAALLGLALRKPLERLMHWYLRQVEKSDLMA